MDLKNNFLSVLPMLTLHPKFSLVLLLAATSGLFAQKPSEQANLSEAPNPIIWKPGCLGAGGFVTGLDLHPSGELILCRTDVGGAYKLTSNEMKWEQVVTTDRLPEGTLGFFDYDGVASIVSAPGDKNRLYLAFSGGLFASDDCGKSWKAAKQSTPLHMDPNARSGRLQGERLAVDPANKDVVYYGSNKDGLWFTTDGGREWQNVPTNQIPAGIEVPSKNKKRSGDFPGVGTIVFDPSSGQFDGRTKRILVSIWGEGIYESMDAGKSWQQTGGSADLTAVESSSIANDGTYGVAQRDKKGAALYRNGKWEPIAKAANKTWQEIVIKPGNSNTIFLFGPGAMNSKSHLRTTNGGVTWEGIGHSQLVAEDVPWLSKEKWFSTGAIKFDPKSDRLWIGQGVGVWYCDNALTSTDLVWTSRSSGIEELVVNDIVVPEPGKPVIACWDRPLFKIEDVGKYPAAYGPTEDFSTAWSIANMAGHPNSLVAIVQAQSNNPHGGAATSGYSDDGGRSWIPFGFKEFPRDVNDPHDWIYGMIAVSSQHPEKIIWSTLGAEKAHFLYSHDRGNTWKDATFSDGTKPGSWNSLPFLYKDAIVADPLDGNAFFAYNWGSKNLYKSSDGGANFEPVGKLPAQFSDYHCKLRAVPGKSGQLFFTPGFNNHNFNDGAMGPLFESTDGGATWKQVSGTEKIIDVAFGAPAPNSNQPTYYVSGQMLGSTGSVRGIFQSTDAGKSWSRISGPYPMGISKGMSNLAADPGIFGCIYVGTSGVGYYVGKLPH